MTDLIAAKSEVKKVIRSLLISAPSGLTLSMLERDYYAVTHEPFPHRKFGYFSAADFAKSLTDILYAKITNKQLMFFGIADEKTEHILKMVQRQKKPKKYNRMFPEGSPSRKKDFKSFLVRPTNQFPSAFLRSTIHKLVCAHPEGFSLSHLPEMYQKLNGFDLPAENIMKMPNIIFGMPDIARLEFGRRDNSGNNLYVYPSKSLLNYKTLVANKVKLNETAVNLGKPPEQAQPKYINSGISGTPMKTTSSSSVTNSTSQSSPGTVESSTSAQSSSTTTETSSTTQSSSDTTGSTTTGTSNSSSSTTASSSTSKSSSNATGGSSSHCTAAKPKTGLSCIQEVESTPADKPKLKVPKNDAETLSEIFKPEDPPKCKQLRNEIIELLEDYEKGLWAIRLPIMYKQKFKKELDLKKLGYFSTIEFMSTLSDQVSICRLTETGDWLLCLRKYEQGRKDKEGLLKEKPSPSLIEIEKELKLLVERFPEGITFSSLSSIYQIQFGKAFPLLELGVTSTEEFIVKLLNRLGCLDGKLILHSSSDKLVAEDTNIPTVPIDAVGSGVCYNSPTTPTKEWDYFDVFVSHVVSPGAFMIQVIGNETTLALDHLMDQMEKCYSKQEGQFYRMPLHLIHVGQICATIYHGDKNWNRAIVTKEPECGFVEVLYVDYGDVASVSVHSIFLLKTSFQVLPAQMIRARLSHLQPVDMERWHSDSRRIMLELCRDKSLVALVTDVDDRGVLSLLICDTKQSDTVDIYINDVLIEKGLAIYVDDSSTIEERKAIKDALHSQQGDHEQEYQVMATPANTAVASSTNGATSYHNDEPPPYELHDPVTNLPSASASETASLCRKQHEKSIFQDPGYILERYIPPPPGFNSFNVLGKKDSHPSLSEQKLIKQCDRDDPVEIHQFSESLTFHVINYEGNLLITSAEISAIFRPNSADILLPLLLMKQLHFEELVLTNDGTHSKLFAELEKHRVKGAVVNGILRQFVTFYQVCDIPSIIVDLGYSERTDLLDFFNQILNKSNNNTLQVTKPAPPCVNIAPVNQPSISSSFTTKQQIHSSATTSHYADSESSSPVRKKLPSHETNQSSSLSDGGKNQERDGGTEIVVDNIADFKFLIKDMNPDILKALNHNMTMKRETMLNQLMTNPSKDLVSKLEKVFLQLKLVEQVLQQKEDAQKDVKCKPKFSSENKIEPANVNIVPTCVTKPSPASPRVHDVFRSEDCLGVIPPVQSKPLSNIFASMSSSSTTSALTVKSPPFKPTPSSRNIVRSLVHPTVTVAPIMAPQNTGPIPSAPWYCVNSVGYTPRPVMQPNAMEVVLPPNTPLAPRPMNPYGLYRQGVWVPTHFPPNNVS